MGFENNVYGNVHPENSYNSENEDRDRHNLENENKSHSSYGNELFVPIEEIEDKDAESDFYEKVEESMTKNKDEFEFDKFGFLPVLNDYFNQVSKDKKAELFQHINEFLVEYRSILDNSKDEKTAMKASAKAFEKIIGTPITGHDAETGKISFEVYRNKYVRVTDKKAPSSAIKTEYDKYGRPVDYEAVKKNNKNKQNVSDQGLADKRNIKTKKSSHYLKLPWRH
jgi:hypothetical protein